MVSADKADWQRERPRFFWDPSRKLLSSVRAYQRCKKKHNLCAYFYSKVIVLRYRFWSTITGAEIPLNGHLGGGLLIPHPNGIVIHPNSLIGVNCLIHQQVTIGVNRNSNKPPTIGGHVDIGAGAKIIGNVKIGNHVQIGANAVVLEDIPDNSISVGVPAKVITKA
ncbi:MULTISPECIES: serine acetyltransferase [Cycloclasticus]|jgi:serine O-acetyltransferase|uniref:serine acetyltransferase n=1 Tax=Cycloclasticus TaxID=34067 RepID=UPI00091AD289|nr:MULTISPECIES: serine acetyltransferase [Cycloclasticus]PHR49470.1 MAG: serine acetyltransferase [Cycloclasticus sp.]SHJ63627.1 serine O-acetyltransferase [Cycloclasticus pugetii]